MTRVVLVEDDATVRGVVEILLSTEPDLELVGVATSAEEAIGLVGTVEPDLVLLDNQLDGELTGLEAAPALKRAAPSVVVLLCTALDLAAAASAAPDVDGYLRKDQLVDLVDVVRALLTGRPTPSQPGRAQEPGNA